MADKDMKISLPGEWALEKILGPTLDEVGKDFALLYRSGVKKISQVAKRKINNIDDNAKANMRVAHAVFNSGSFSDEAISAEYFGGILAASRSADGKDDTGIFYLDIVRSLSASQLKMHYFIYSALNELLVKDKTKEEFNPARSEQMANVNVLFLTNELVQLGINMDTDLLALNNKDLINTFEYSSDIDPDKIVHLTQVVPTSLGVQLYAISCNNLSEWRNFSHKNIDTFENIQKPQLKSLSVNEILENPFIKLAKSSKTQ